MNTLINKANIPFARCAIFIVYFWFGILKIVGESPATPLVKALFNQTISKTFTSLALADFIIIFGVFEILIGILFLIPKLEKLAFLAIGAHIIMTSLPLFLLPELVWIQPWVPSLEGQYIIKNVLIVGLVLNIFTHRSRKV